MEQDDPGSEKAAMPIESFDPGQGGFVKGVLVSSPTGFRIYTAPYVFEGARWEQVKNVTIGPASDVQIEVEENATPFRVRPVEHGTDSADAATKDLLGLLDR